MNINWRNDGITREWIRRNITTDLETFIKEASAHKLGEAITYCKDIYNAFAYELLKRSGHLDRFNTIRDEKERSKIFDSCCRYHGFMLG